MCKLNNINNNQNQKYKKVKRLKKGSTLGIISPSWSGPQVFPKTFELGIKRLEEFGFKIKILNSCIDSPDKLLNNPKLRADDINSAFLDEKIDGIICSIGGDDCVLTLPYLDEKIIKNNPKFFMGYSDPTLINVVLNNLGIVSFNGPAVMAGFAESKKLEDDFIKHINNFLFCNWDVFEYEKFSRYTNKSLSWENPENLKKENPNYILNQDDWHFISGSKNVVGKLWGGCIEVLEFIKGTKFFPSVDFFENKILFFETSEDKPTVNQVKYMFRNYATSGILNKASGILFGRARDYTEDEKKELENMILDVLKSYNLEDLVVVTNVDFGHTSPQFILPLGCNLKIDVEDKKLILVENPFC